MNFTASVRALFQSLLSDNAKVSQRAQLVVLTCVYTFFTIAFAAFVGIVQPDIILRSTISALGALVLGVASLWLSRRGYTVAGCWLFIAGNIAFVTQRSLIGGGIHAPNVVMYFVFALIAGALLGRVAWIITATAAVLICLLMALGQEAGLVPAPIVSHSTLTDWWLILLCMSIIMFIVYLQTLSMSRARARLEDELARRRRMEAHLNVALRAGAVGIWDSDLNSGMAWTDERTAQLFGVVRGPDGTVPFEEWKSKVHPEDRHKVDGAIEAMMTRNARGKMRYRIIRPDGELRHIEGTGAAVAGEDGTIVSHVGTVTDVTEKKRRERDREKSERERRLLEEQLLQAQKREVMGTLAGGIAHDFNNLLAAIQNFAALIESDTASSAESRQFAGRILAGCGRGKDIVAQILTFARTGGQRQEVLDLSQFLSESEPLLSPAIARGARLRLPKPHGPVWVKGNPGQFLQLIANLCVNAGEALTEEGGQGEIAVTLIAASKAQVARLADAVPSPHAHSTGQVDPSLSYALLCVRDDGPGMTTEVLKRVFDPFFTTKGRQYGSGLGLAVCQGIVESHRGFCLVESQPAKGTRFSVLLPLEEAPSVLPEPQGTGPLVLGFERILLVDDDPDVLDSMSLGLKRLGYKVASFTDPLQALAAVEREPCNWDLVIADRIMPGLYGPELLERIRRATPNIRTILCSGHAEDSYDGPPSSIDLILAKPVAAAELTAAVRDLLALK